LSLPLFLAPLPFLFFLFLCRSLSFLPSSLPSVLFFLLSFLPSFRTRAGPKDHHQHHPRD
jgi:hypothetical protein